MLGLYLRKSSDLFPLRGFRRSSERHKDEAVADCFLELARLNDVYAIEYIRFGNAIWFIRVKFRFEHLR